MFLQSLGALLPVLHQLPCRCQAPNDADFDVSKRGLGFHRWDWDGLLGSHWYVHHMKVPTVGREEPLIVIKLFLSSKTQVRNPKRRFDFARPRGRRPPQVSAEGQLLEKFPRVSETTLVLGNAFAHPKSGTANPPSPSPAPSPRKRRQAGQPAADAPLLAPGSAQGHSQAHTRTQSTAVVNMK